MYITGRHDRLFEFFPKTDDLPVDILQILFGIDISIPVTVDHKLVVSKRLDFIIIIKFCQPCNSLRRFLVQDRLIQLTGLTGTSYDQTLSVLIQKTFRNPRSSRKICQMRS